MKDTFVAFFDILGFKNLVEKNKHEDLMQIYQDALYDTLDLTEQIVDPIYKLITPESEIESLDIKTYVISDSIILIQKDLSKRGLLNLIARCQILLSSSLSDGIPLRGAISYGPVSIIENKRGTTIVGLGLTKAYILESSQNWSGGIVDKGCFELFPFETGDSIIKTLLHDKKNPLIIKYNIPLKNFKFKVGYGFNWPKYDLIKNENDITKSFTRHKKELPSEKEQIMLKNTLNYYKHVKKLLQL